MEVTSQSYIALHTDPYTNGLFVELFPVSSLNINSDRPKEMSQWLTPWGDRFVRVATRAAD